MSTFNINDLSEMQKRNYLSDAKCKKGKDSQCVKDLGLGACCFYAKNTVDGGKRDSIFGGYTAAKQADLGWPMDVGDESTFCVDLPTKLMYEPKVGEDAMTREFKHVESKEMMIGYCTGATKLAATVSAAAFAIFTASF